MGSAITNVPTIILNGGYMEPGIFQGECVTMVDTAKKYEAYKAGNLSETELKELVNAACPTPGACPEMATAHTMAAVSEALGMSLPGNTAVAATGADLIRIAQTAGEMIMELFHKNICPSDIITRESYENAIRVVLAVGGSPNALVHLPAIMRNAGIEDIGWKDWDRLSRNTPYICSVLPNTRQYTVKDLDRAGRIPAVMKELEPLLNLDVMTVTGKTLRENLEGATVKDRKIIKPLDAPFSEDGGLAILHGNLAPEGAIVKKSAVPSSMLQFKGKAKVFDCEEDAADALSEGRIHPGDTVVVRYEGPKGSPGGKKVYLPMHKIVGMGLAESVAFITDGALSGTNLGLAVAYVSPEGASGGPISVLQDGDEIEIDIPNRKLEVKLHPAELDKRHQNWTAPEPKATLGALGLFASSAESYAKGAYVF
jgi:dihydroxy-acid dehydratase